MRSVRAGATCLGAALAAALAVPAGSAGASDYSNTCTSRDKRYVVEDGALYRASDRDRKQRLAYAVLEEQVLERREGYCLAKDGDGKESRFGFEASKSRRVVMVDDGPKRVRAELVCELAMDGLPAAYRCAREVVTRDDKTPEAVRSFAVGSRGAWHHNGSVMRLDAIDEARAFIYMNPRDGLRREGVSAETVLFTGERKGQDYAGTAYVFNRTCGQREYGVRGRVEDGERRVVLDGQAPILGPDCTVVGTRPDRLVFELKR